MSRTFENRYFKKVAEQTSDAIVIADRAGRITWTNPAFVKLCGYERREVLGKKPGSFLQGKQTDRKTAHNVKEAIRKRTPIQAEILNYHKDDHPYWVHLSIDPLHDANGEPTGFIAVERDITPEVLERRRTEEELGSVYRALIDTLKHQETVVE